MHKTLVAGGAVWLLPLALLCQLPYQQGWPVEVTGYLTSPIAIADIDDDGQNELVVSDSQPGASPQFAKLYVFAVDGDLKPGWPIEKASSYNAPAIADLDDDGMLEMLSIASGIHLYTAGGTLLWEHLYTGPIFQGIYGPNNATIEDIDNDGNLEIIATCGSGGVFVFDAQGNVRPGWPVVIPPKSPYTGAPPITMSASIADMDLDGLKEIIFGTAQGQFYCLKPDGSICSGFPLIAPGVVSGYGYKPILYDLIGDGFLEILIPDSPTFTFRVYDYQANVLRSLGYFALPLTFGDPDGDGVMDVGFRSGLAYHLFETAGFTEHPNFPINFSGGPYNGWYMSHAAFADLNGDSAQEVLSGSACCGFVSDGRMFAADMNGAIVPSFPTGILFHRATANKYPAINDLDGDGDLEFCIGSTNDESAVPRPSSVYCWDSPHPYNLDNVDWAMDGFDLGHTGRWRKLYHISKAGSQLAVSSCQGQGNPCYLPPDGSLISVDVTAIREHGGANPAGQDVRYSRTLGCGNYEGPVVDHGDGTYTRMLRAPSADCTTDIHAWVNEFKLADYQQIQFCAACVPPSAFTLLSPSNGAADQPTSLTLDWEDAAGATAYDLYLGTVNPPPLHQADLIASQYSASGLAPGQTYYWTVVARNPYGATPTATWSFTVCPTLGAFGLTAPADGAANLPQTVTLAWSAAAGAQSYTLYLGETTPPPLYQAGLTSTQITLTWLLMGRTFYWRVEAVNPCGALTSPVWSFTTAPCAAAPGPFENLCPADGATDLPLDVELIWEASDQAVSYEIWLGSTPETLTPVGTTTAPAHPLHNLSENTTYYWQTRAVNPCGTMMGPVWSFTTGTDAECRHCRPVSPP